MKKYRGLMFCFALTLLITGCAGTYSSGQTTLTISAAASLTNVMTDLESAFSKAYPQVKLIYNFGASGALQEQIENGAPADVFISAGAEQISSLLEEQYLVEDSIVNLLVNEVVLVVPAAASSEIESFAELAGDQVQTLAIGDPDSVPAGQYAKEVLTSLDLLTAVSAKTVYCKDVRQVLTYVENGEADAGIVYATDAISSDQVKIAAQAPDGTHEAIIYPAAIIKASEKHEVAKLFLDFLNTLEAVEVFESYGFKLAD